MAHSHDWTKLSQFGFSDPDKKDPDHELACAYLAQKDVAKKLIGAVEPKYPETYEKALKVREWFEKNFDEKHEHVFAIKDEQKFKEAFFKTFGHLGPGEHTILAGVSKKHLVRTFVEWHITKGKGKFKTSQGWIDVAMDAQVYFEPYEEVITIGPSGQGLCRKDSLYRPRHTKAIDFRTTIGVEVKIQAAPISDVIRQLSFYDTYFPCSHWVVVTTRDITDAEKGLLDKSEIKHFKLGSDFEEFKSKKANTVSKPSMEI